MAANSVAHCCSFALKTHAISSRKRTSCNSSQRSVMRIRAHIPTYSSVEAYLEAKPVHSGLLLGCSVSLVSVRRKREVSP